MALLIAFAIFIGSMLICLIKGISMLVALAVGLVCFFIVGLRRGYPALALAKMALSSAKSSLIVLRIFFLIGLITALWRSSGTIAYFVYYGIQLIRPSLFILLAFLLSCLLSYAMGTCFGVTGTLGIILMTLAHSGGVNEIIAAGAIISGAYFGDRCSPVSSSANLVAAVTHTDIFDNVHMMLKTGLIPLLLCAGIYLFWSIANPIQAVDPAMLAELQNSFQISLWAVLPAVLILVLPLFRVQLRYAMLLSILSAFVLSLALQGMDIGTVLKSCVLGYQPPAGSFAEILAGGGLVSMLNVACIVLLSSTYAGIFNGTDMLHSVQAHMGRLVDKIGAFATMAIISTLACAVFCNQTMAVMMGQQLMERVYASRGATNTELAIDIENSAITIAGLVPWSISCTVPLQMLGVGVRALPYSILLYAIPIVYLFSKRLWFPPKRPLPKEEQAQ